MAYLDEIWKDISSCPNYQASNLGNIRSKDFIVIRSDGKPHTVKSKILKQSLNSGYLCVNVKGKKYVHQLIAEAFLNHKTKGHKGKVVDHIDNDRMNNKLSNLQLITNRQNCSKNRTGISDKTGVFWRKNRGHWFSQIQINGKQTYLGSFKTELEASNAYQNKLKQIQI